MEVSSCISQTINTSIIGVASDQICEQSNRSQLSGDCAGIEQCIVPENSLQSYSTTHRQDVRNWVKQTQDYFQEKRKLSTEDNSVSEKGDESGVSGNVNKKRKNWHKLPLDMICEWEGCVFKDTSVENFVKHVSFHITEVSIKTIEDDYDVYACLWANCDYMTPIDKEIVRHINFHAYHTKVKSAGKNMMKEFGLPTCTLMPEQRNILPELPSEFSCEWQGCSRAFNNSQMFFFHVAGHVMANYVPGRKKKRIRDINCNWLGCSGKFYDVYKLSDHVKIHTHEKVIGCPHCGNTFASPTKFYDHCKRQDADAVSLRCQTCSKYFTSERLLRDHMRMHVSRYKCSFCDMTCVSPASLSLHIRYRHLNVKPFKCNYCSFSAKTQRDLNRHVNVHSVEPVFSCTEEGCTFSCRTQNTLTKHQNKEHYGEYEPSYCCHICDRLFTGGASLTKHLFRFHKFQWTPGHTRFRYTRDEDGYYRLKPYRLETLEVMKEVLKEELDETSNSEETGRYYLRHRRRQEEEEEEEEKQQENEEDEDDPQEIERQEEEPKESDEPKKIIITIEEFNSTGQVIHCQTIETEEMPIEKKSDAIICYLPREGSDGETDSEEDN